MKKWIEVEGRTPEEIAYYHIMPDMYKLFLDSNPDAPMPGNKNWVDNIEFLNWIKKNFKHLKSDHGSNNYK